MQRKHIRVFLLIFIIHSILYCTFYLIAHLTHFILLFAPPFSFPPIFIYIFSCVMFLCFYCLCYFYFILYLISIIFLFIFCTFHWADLSWPTFHYWLYPVWLCMWQIIKNLEPWTLRRHVWLPGWEVYVKHYADNVLTQDKSSDWEIQTLNLWQPQAKNLVKACCQCKMQMWNGNKTFSGQITSGQISQMIILN